MEGEEKRMVLRKLNGLHEVTQLPEDATPRTHLISLSYPHLCEHDNPITCNSSHLLIHVLVPPLGFSKLISWCWVAQQFSDFLRNSLMIFHHKLDRRKENTQIGLHSNPLPFNQNNEDLLEHFGF